MMIDCERCGMQISDSAVWCQYCVRSGRVDLELIRSALVDGWLRRIIFVDFDDIDTVASLVYRKLVAFDRLALPVDEEAFAALQNPVNE